jgi:hypothetical protein
MKAKRKVHKKKPVPAEYMSPAEIERRQIADELRLAELERSLGPIELPKEELTEK